MGSGGTTVIALGNVIVERFCKHGDCSGDMSVEPSAVGDVG